MLEWVKLFFFLNKIAKDQETIFKDRQMAFKQTIDVCMAKETINRAMTQPKE